MNSNKVSNTYRCHVEKLNIYSMKHDQQLTDSHFSLPCQSMKSTKKKVYFSSTQQIKTIEANNNKMHTTKTVQYQKFSSQKTLHIQQQRSGYSIQNQSLALKKLNQSNTFVCGHCDNLQGQCQICLGEHQLNGNSNFLKFLDFMLKFKIGQNKSYKPVRRDTQRNSINSHCTLFYSSKCLIDASISINSSNSLNCSDIQERENLYKMVHSDYQCDCCGSLPIVGIRYHCKHQQCKNDVDLCQQCFRSQGHNHREHIQQIKQSQIYTKRKNLLENVQKDRFKINKKKTKQKQNRGFINKIQLPFKL